MIKSRAPLTPEKSIKDKDHILNNLIEILRPVGKTAGITHSVLQNALFLDDFERSKPEAEANEKIEIGDTLQILIKVEITSDDLFVVESTCSGWTVFTSQKFKKVISASLGN